MALFSAFVGAGAASADTTIDGPVGLGTAAAFGVLGGQAVTDTGASSITGELGVSPGTSITGMPVSAPAPQSDTVSAQAQADTGTAYDVAASLSPTSSGLTDLVGLTLIPGVYSGGALSLSGTLTLAGSADSVWVFQAASTLVTASSSHILLTGGASSCNVFWQVGSSATLGTASTMVGTVMALQSITSANGTNVDGRLLARNGAVTLDHTTIVSPSGCTTPVGTVGTSPTITATTPPPATLGEPYSFDLQPAGTGTTTSTVASGALPSGLRLDSTTGTISGTPTRAGTFRVNISASNGIAPAALGSYRILVSSRLAATGSTSTVVAPFAVSATVGGIALILLSRRYGAGRRLRRHRA